MELAWLRPRVNLCCTVGDLYAVVFLTIDGDYGWWIQDMAEGKKLGVYYHVIASGRAVTEAEAVDVASRELRRLAIKGE